MIKRPGMPHVDDPRLSFDPAQLDATIARAKIQIRKRMKALRAGHGGRALAERSRKIVERVLSLPEFDAAGSVALFWPMVERGEVDLRPLDAVLRERGKQVFYPFMRPLGEGRFQTGFAVTHTLDELVPSTQGFLQPSSQSSARPGAIDLVLVPALAADARGHRIGYGAGYYDSTLGDVRPPAKAWIVAYHFQLMAELPVERHDQACDGIITDDVTLPVDPPSAA